MGDCALALLHVASIEHRIPSSNVLRTSEGFYVVTGTGRSELDEMLLNIPIIIDKANLVIYIVLKENKRQCVSWVNPGQVRAQPGSSLTQGSPDPDPTR
jgi:hypothetical protein